MSLTKGQKLKLETSLVLSEITVSCSVKAPFHIDVSCFGLDSAGKLSDDSYMVFYNQTKSPEEAISLLSDVPDSKFKIDLIKLPDTIDKLVFTAAIDPAHTQAMNELDSLRFQLGEHVFTLSGSDFSKEKAIMIAEIYRKDSDWRLGVNGQGFSGGLDSILVHFGGEVAATPTTPAPTSSTISLEKRFQDKAPQLVSLAKIATVSLAKNKLENVRAKVAFVIDASGSMTNQYRQGRVQEAVNRVFPLGVHFDDDEELETWAFALKSKQLTNVKFDNFKDYVERESGGWSQWMRDLNAGYNNEPAVIRDVIKHFSGCTPPPAGAAVKSGLFGGLRAATEFAPAIKNKTPIFVLFISDGGVSHNDEIEHLIRWSSTLPIFWQFIGIGGSSYGALSKLDSLSGRHIDNANFFAIDDLLRITEAELYDRMMLEFPQWLKEAKAKGMIDDYTI